MLKLQNICYNKNVKNILNNINYEIKEPSVVVITGPNGSGKSTIAKIIMGIEKPDSGKILTGGRKKCLKWILSRIGQYNFTCNCQFFAGFSVHRWTY